MAKGAGRGVAAWMLVVAALAAIFGLGLLTMAVQQAEEQVADLDESAARAGQTAYVAAWGTVALVVGAVLSVIAAITYLVSTIRARRARIERAPAPRAIALVATLAFALTLAYALLSPTGPVLTAVSVAGGGGGPSNAVQLEEFGGVLTAASLAGQTSEEDTHVFRPVATYGEITLRMLSQAQAGNAGVIAILEAPEGDGWRELARTQPTGDSKVSLPPATYGDDLRIRVRVADGTAGTVGYELFVSFDPE